jgi:ribosome modulation factor
MAKQEGNLVSAYERGYRDGYAGREKVSSAGFDDESLARYLDGYVDGFEAARGEFERLLSD